MPGGDGDGDTNSQVAVKALRHEAEVGEQEAHLEPPDANDIAGFGVSRFCFGLPIQTANMWKRTYKGAPMYWIRPKL